MADRKSDHLYTTPKGGESRRMSPKRKGTPPPSDAKSSGHKASKVGGRVSRIEEQSDIGSNLKISQSHMRQESPSPVRNRHPDYKPSPGAFQPSRRRSPNPQFEDPHQGPRYAQELNEMRHFSPYDHRALSPQQQQHPHQLAGLSTIQQMERKYSPIPFSGYMEPKVILDRLELAIPAEGHMSPDQGRKVSPGSVRRYSPSASHSYRGEQKIPSSGLALEMRRSPASHLVERHVSPLPPFDQRPSSISPLPAHMERRPSPAHMPGRTSPVMSVPILGAGLTPPPAHVPQQKPLKTSPSVYIGTADSPVERKASPAPPTFLTDARIPQGAHGQKSSLSPGSFHHGDKSRLSPTPALGGPGYIERKLSPSRDGRPSPSPLKAYLLQAVPESERRSPSRHVDAIDRKPSPSSVGGERHLSPAPARPSPLPVFSHSGVGPPGPRFSPTPRQTPSPSRPPDHFHEALHVHVPHHAQGPVVRISPSRPGEGIPPHLSGFPLGSLIGEDIKGHLQAAPALPRAMVSPPRGAPVPGKPLLSTHLTGAPFVPGGAGPQPSPAFISQGLIMHTHPQPRVSAPQGVMAVHSHPLHHQANPFSFPGTVLSSALTDTTAKLSAAQPTPAAVTHPLAQGAAVSKSQSHFIRKAMSDVTAFKTSPRRTEDSDCEGMPRLTPEGPWMSVSDSGAKPATSHSGQLPNDKEADYTTMPNPFSMRVQILNNFPTNSAIYRSAYRSQSVAMHRAKCSCITSAAKSLDILRQNLQKNINKEIDAIIQNYMEKFFKPGIENIKLNNGLNSVSEEHIHAVSRQILEEAKKMYISERPRSTTPLRDIPDNVSETGSSSGRIRIPSRRRRPSDSDSEISLPVKRKRKGRPPLNMSGRGTPSKPFKSHSPLRREGPKWDTDRLKVDTLFVMGAKANKALGLGATRGRLYIKHPDIFKYSGDQDDKQWLFDHHYMPAIGGKAYILMVEDVQELAESDEYRDSPNLILDELNGFTVPEWMLEKMKIQMAAMRTDTPKAKATSRSRSGTPDSRTPVVAGTVNRDTKLPFSAFSRPGEKEGLVGVQIKTEPSPSNTEDMELLSTGDNEEQNHVEMSPLNMGGGFEDVNSDLDALDEAPFLAQ